MNALGAIAFGIGMQDGLNPCIFMTCGVFIILGLWLRLSALRVIWFRIFFVLVYALGALIFNFGPAQIFIFQKNFILAAKILYFVLGAGAFAAGILFIRDWFFYGQQEENLIDQKLKCFAPRGLVAGLLTMVLAVVLSAIATLWPINSYFMILGNEAIIKGQWHTVIPLLAGYVFAGMWPLWLVWAFLSIKNVKPSLLKIFCAVIFLTASTTMIFIFKS